MQVELIGCTGAGKSTLLEAMIQACAAQGIPASSGEDTLLQHFGLGWVRLPLARSVLLDVLALPYTMRSWKRNRAFLRFAWKVIKGLPRTVRAWDRLNIARNVLKKVGLHEALVHGGIANNCKVDIQWVDSEDIERHGPERYLMDVHGILVPGGFGSRGIEGKIQVIRYCRENGIPFLGICYGMQLAVVEYARHVVGLTGAHTTEAVEDGFEVAEPVVCILPEQVGITQKGGTMRLGGHDVEVADSAALGAAEVGPRTEHHAERVAAAVLHGEHARGQSRRARQARALGVGALAHQERVHRDTVAHRVHRGSWRGRWPTWSTRTRSSCPPWG